MAYRANRCDYCSACVISGSVQGEAVDQAVVLRFRRDHAVEWIGTHSGHDIRPDRRVDPLSSPHARILFISVAFGSVDLRPSAIAANQTDLAVH